MSVTVDNAFNADEVVTAFLETLINKGTSPIQIMVGIHNTFVFGEILDKNGYVPFDGKDLGAFFDSIDAATAAMRRLCGEESDDK